MKSLKFDIWILEMEFFYVIFIMIYVKFDILGKKKLVKVDKIGYFFINKIIFFIVLFYLKKFLRY